MSDPTPETATESPEAQIAYTRWLSQLRADMAQTIGGVLLRGARAVPVQAGGAQINDPTTAYTSQPATSATSLMGLSLAMRETGTTESYVVLRDGAGGPVLLQLELFPGAPLTHWFGPGGIHFSNGIVIDSDYGIAGSVFLRGSD